MFRGGRQETGSVGAGAGVDNSQRKGGNGEMSSHSVRAVSFCVEAVERRRRG